MLQYGEVLQSEGERALVRIGRGDCANCCGCAEGFNEKKPDIWVENNLRAQPPQHVAVEFEPRRAILAATLLFFVPILALLVGAFSGIAIGNIFFPTYSEESGIIGGIVFLGVYITVIAVLDRKLKNFWGKGPRIVEVVPEIYCEKSTDSC